MVSVVIAAFNEAATIADVVAVPLAHDAISEVIVVDDGSSDGTAEIASKAGARVVRFERNAGKARALDAGVKLARDDVILFLDADVTGLDPEKLTRIMQPVVEGRHEMYVGVRARRTIWLNWLLRIAPILGGERALTRRLWEAVPDGHKHGFQIEIALNYTAKQFERGMGFELVDGVVHRIKEQKYGIRSGFLRRIRMMVDLVRISWRLYVLGAIRGLLR